MGFIDEIKQNIDNNRYLRAWLTTEIVQARDFEKWLGILRSKAIEAGEPLTKQQEIELEQIWVSHIAEWSRMVVPQNMQQVRNQQTQQTRKREEKQAPAEDETTETNPNKIINAVLSKVMKSETTPQIQSALKHWSFELGICNSLNAMVEKYKNRIILRNGIDTEKEEETIAQVLRYIDSYINLGLSNNNGQLIFNYGKIMEKYQNMQETIKGEVDTLKDDLIPLIVTLVDIIGKSGVLPEAQMRHLKQAVLDEIEQIRYMEYSILDKQAEIDRMEMSL